MLSVLPTCFEVAWLFSCVRYTSKHCIVWSYVTAGLNSLINKKLKLANTNRWDNPNQENRSLNLVNIYCQALNG